MADGNSAAVATLEASSPLVAEALRETHSVELTAARHAGAQVLDEALALLDAGETATAVSGLIAELDAVRRSMTLDSWRSFIETTCAVHPIKERLWQDPFTKRSAAKPRGYSGDAVLLDYIYRGLPAEEEEKTSREGVRIFASTARGCASTDSVRDRRDILTSYIDATARRVTPSRMMSVACGHLREAQLTGGPVQEGRVSEFIAVDQDPLSLKVIEDEFAGLGVTPTNGSVRDFLKGNLRFSDLDLVYAAGLYDYLPQDIATKLTEVLFGTVGPGGTLLIGNFAPNGGTGYMEAFMNWKLVYREPPDLIALTAAIDPTRIGSQRTFASRNGYIIYLELTRA